MRIGLSRMQRIFSSWGKEIMRQRSINTEKQTSPKGWSTYSMGRPMQKSNADKSQIGWGYEQEVKSQGVKAWANYGYTCSTVREEEDLSPKVSSVRTVWVYIYQTLTLSLLVILMTIGFCLMLVLGLPMMVVSSLMNNCISKHRRIKMNMASKTQGSTWRKVDRQNPLGQYGSNFTWGKN